MNNETLAILEKLSSDVVLLKWVWGLSLAFGIFLIWLFCVFIRTIYNVIVMSYSIKVRYQNRLKNNELIKLRFRGIGDYFEDDDPGVVISLFLIRPDLLLFVGSPILEKIVLKKIKQTPDQLYARLFLAFYYADNKYPDKAMEQIMEIRNISKEWHQEFMNTFMRAVQTKINTKNIIPGGNVYEFKIKK